MVDNRRRRRAARPAFWTCTSTRLTGSWKSIVWLLESVNGPELIDVDCGALRGEALVVAKHIQAVVARLHGEGELAVGVGGRADAALLAVGDQLQRTDSECRRRRRRAGGRSARSAASA